MRTTRHARWPLAALAALLVAVGVSPAAAHAATEIHFWHAMTGALGERVTELVQKFNATQKEFEVKALHKGNYTETLTGAIAAYRAKTPPHIVQVFEVGTQTMLSSGAVYPVYQLMKDQGMDLNWADFVAPVKSYYSKEGHLYSMPFNSSTPILYYNKDIFKKAGLDPAKPPTTFPEIEQAAGKIISSGAAKCGFSHAWPSWTMVENMHAWHDQSFADNQNGFAGLAKELKVNGEFGVKVIDTLARWQKEGIYT
ncbi:MAG: extracellular solute-binding protein, partial [Candidatus Methylomirabilales bacterium]